MAAAGVVRARNQLVARRVAVVASLAGTAVGGKIIASVARHACACLVVAHTIPKAVAATGAREELVARRIVVVRRKARAAVGRNVKARFARAASAGLVVACTVTKAVTVTGACEKLVAHRVSIIRRDASAAVLGNIVTLETGVTDAGLVVAGAVAVAVAARAGLDFVAVREAIPAVDTRPAICVKIVSGVTRYADARLVIA